MDSVFLVWLGVFALGVVLGQFLNAPTVGKFLVAALGICVAGLVLTGALKMEGPTWFFGIALMALPILGGLLFGGVALGNFLGRSKRGKSENVEDA